MPWNDSHNEYPCFPRIKSLIIIKISWYKYWRYIYIPDIGFRAIFIVERKCWVDQYSRRVTFHDDTVGFSKHFVVILGLYSLSGKTPYRKISWSLEAARLGFKLFQSLCNLAGTSAALLPRCLSNFRAIRPLQHPISRLRDFTRFGGKTSYRLVNRGPG